MNEEPDTSTNDHIMQNVTNVHARDVQYVETVTKHNNSFLLR